MLTVGVLASGVVAGFVWRTRKDKRKGGLLRKKYKGLLAAGKGMFSGGGKEAKKSDNEAKNGTVEGSPMEVVKVTARRAFLSSLVLFRVQTMAAFKRTSKHYAPVPLTYVAAMATSGPFVFGTVFFINFALFNGVSIVVRSWKKRNQTHAEARAVARKGAKELDNELTHISCAAVGLTGYLVCLVAWEKSPLRGSLTVFGKDPHLDRCASAERYIMEKLALLATAGYKATATLRQLRGANEGNSPAAAGPLATYASQILTVGNFFGVNGTFKDFSERYVETNKDLKGLASKLKYPGQMGRLEPTMDKASVVVLAPLRGKQAASDIAIKLNELRKELGLQLHITMAFVLPMTFGAGWVLGMELAQVPFMTKQAKKLKLA
mmetsp:Transcript_29182/g.82304  ORF Transcript_29182/g.82304 Transcript_29182/m.82304 type:complete len:378 (-) Transcript_29182:416-1549(-)|eukprot:CAMPEP_0117668818 /NCGR_PEP_ID=MMETSP0804-20121206/11770_1 /TAXON_ID=1074897 /ORGANISM="Tetraselmis astigmatica, Strain CCMP880" /LENGTH=377 /DNA_ID=CAMNT_0005476771 /DNA_START=123 /DNA_END=1256 /DNA_ORIENTATION=+